MLLVAIGCSDSKSASDTNSTVLPKSEQVSNSNNRIQFQDVAPEAGVRFSFRNGTTEQHATMLETLGGGVGIFDYDRDGLADVLLSGGGSVTDTQQVVGSPSALFRNLDGLKFQNVSQPAAIEGGAFYSHGVSATDFDNDGFTDVLITGYGGLHLHHNEGDGSFTDVILDSRITPPPWSNSAAWGDINGDGSLDLLIVQYLNWSFENDPTCRDTAQRRLEVCNPKDFRPLPDALFISNGDGTFRDATREYGIRSDGKGLGVLMADVDLDGDTDIYVANDTTANFLYRNDGRDGLKEVGLTSGSGMDRLGGPDGSMGTDIADFDGDGLPDLWVVNYEQESFVLYRNNGDCTFGDVSRLVGIEALSGLYVGWGTVFLDADLDGDPDLFVSNGHPNRYPFLSPRRQLPLMFANHAGKRFKNVATSAGTYMSTPHNGRGAAIGDLNNDGDFDVVVSHIDEPAAILENVTAGTRRWLRMRLIGRSTNRDAIGAVVRIQADDREQVVQVKGGGSYLSTSDLRLLVGLGASTTATVKVDWPSGMKQELAFDSVDRELVLVEPEDAVE